MTKSILYGLFVLISSSALFASNVEESDFNLDTSCVISNPSSDGIIEGNPIRKPFISNVLVERQDSGIPRSESRRDENEPKSAKKEQ